MTLLGTPEGGYQIARIENVYLWKGWPCTKGYYYQLLKQGKKIKDYKNYASARSALNYYKSKDKKKKTTDIGV